MIHGAIISEVDHGAPKITTAQQFPSNWFEMTFTADAGKPDHLWIHGRAENDSWQNDSVYAQFSDSLDASGIGFPHRHHRCDMGQPGGMHRVRRAGLGLAGQRVRQRAAISDPTSISPLRAHVRFQTREDGFSIGQVVLSAKAYLRTAPGGNINDPTIVQSGTPPPPSGHDEIALWAASDATVVQGVWRVTADATAAGQQSISNPDAGGPKIGTPAVTRRAPSRIVDAEAGKAYHLWMRLKAENDYWGNDSAWVQFSDSVDQNGQPLFQSGTASGTFVSLEECSGCGEQGGAGRTTATACRRPWSGHLLRDERPAHHPGPASRGRRRRGSNRLVRYALSVDGARIRQERHHRHTKTDQP